MINCKLNRDIALGSNLGDGCMSISINVGVADGLYIYNLEDVKGLVFSGDTRPDKSLFIDTIITNQPFYRVDATNIQYTEEYDDHSYTHTLTAYIKSVSREIEEILEAAVHGKYLVAFEVVGEEHYRLVGWKEGLALDEELNISKENNSYTLTFRGVTTFPEMEADKSNFDLANKVFEPTFEPLFEAGKVTCSNGWAVANYVVKVNAAGQALDEDNKLVQYSGKRQDAYKLQGVSDGDYHIIGTYTETDYIEGKAVRIFDTTLCNIACSISVSPNTVNFNSSRTTSAITINSSDEWELVTYPSTVTLSRTYGGVNDQTVYVYSNGYCGNETLTFKNKKGGCTATLGISVNVIKIGSVFYYPNRTSSVTLSPITCCNYTGSTSEGTFTKNSDGSFTVSGISGRDAEKSITVTLGCNGETKTVTLIIYGIDTTPGRRVISEYCETTE
jgi:hypothetical protein